MAATGTDVSTSWASWVNTHLTETGWSNREMGRRAKVNDATIGRWRKGENVPREADVIRKVAEAVGENPVVALIAAGLITAAEVSATVTTTVVQLREVTDDALVDEIGRRFRTYAQQAKGPDESTGRTRPIRRVVATESGVTRGQEGEQWAARRDERGKSRRTE